MISFILFTIMLGLSVQVFALTVKGLVKVMDKSLDTIRSLGGGKDV